MDILHSKRDGRPVKALPVWAKGKSFEEEFLDRLRESSPASSSCFSGWLYPCYPVRIFLVAAVWAIPGCLFTLILDVFLRFHDPAVAGTAGALLGALIGGCMEKK